MSTIVHHGGAMCLAREDTAELVHTCRWTWHWPLVTCVVCKTIGDTNERMRRKSCATDAFLFPPFLGGGDELERVRLDLRKEIRELQTYWGGLKV